MPSSPDTSLNGLFRGRGASGDLQGARQAQNVTAAAAKAAGKAVSAAALRWAQDARM